MTPSMSDEILTVKGPRGREGRRGRGSIENEKEAIYQLELHGGMNIFIISLKVVRKL